MKDLVDALVATLVAQARTYGDLAPLLDEEERVLVRADARALAEITGRRGALLSRLTRLERDRQVALGRLAEALGVDARSLTVSRLIELAPASRDALAPVREELGGLLTRLVARNGRNRVLVERTLGCLRGLYSAVVTALTTGPTYTMNGRTDPPLEQLRLLDRSA